MQVTELKRQYDRSRVGSAQTVHMDVTYKSSQDHIYYFRRISVKRVKKKMELHSSIPLFERCNRWRMNEVSFSVFRISDVIFCL